MQDDNKNRLVEQSDATLALAADKQKTKRRLVSRGLNEMLELISQPTKQVLQTSNNDVVYRQARDIYNDLTNDGFGIWTGHEDRKKPLTDALLIFQQLANQGYGKAFYPLSTLYCGEQSIPANLTLADHYSKLAFDYLCNNQLLDDVEIWSDLGKLYFMREREKEKPDWTLPYYWFEKAANLGAVNCMWHLVGFFQKDENWNDALYWQIMAAKAGHKEAQSGLVMQHEHGYLMEQVDDKQVFGWYVWSAEQGHAEAQYILGDIYCNSEVISNDRQKAAYWYGKAAAQGHLEAQYWLGCLHVRNVDELFDIQLGLQYFKSSAEAGYVPSMVWLGRRYEHGVFSLEKNDVDYKQAFYWFGQAAERGNARAQRSLGRMYEKGRGVVQDFIEAKYWYELATEQGDTQAQESLARLEIRKNLMLEEMKRRLEKMTPDEREARENQVRRAVMERKAKARENNLKTKDM